MIIVVGCREGTNLVKDRLYLNPFTTFIECFHNAAYYGDIRDQGLCTRARRWSIASLSAVVVLVHKFQRQFGSFI